MDYQNLMITPVMDRDIGSTFMACSMPMMPMAPMGGMYPYYGIFGGQSLKPIQNDKFESLEKKKQETKNSVKKVGVFASLITAGLLIASRGKIKGKLSSTKIFQNLAKNKTFRKAKVLLYKAKKSVKNFFAGVANKFKSTPATPTPTVTP